MYDCRGMLRCMIAEECSDGRRSGSFSGCRSADELVRIFDPPEKTSVHKTTFTNDVTQLVGKLTSVREKGRGAQQKKMRLLNASQTEKDEKEQEKSKKYM